MAEGKWGEFHNKPDLNFATIAGGVAGDLTVTGIKTTDQLKAVVVISEAGANLVGEFTITADDTINNVGGTSTATKTVLVVWQVAEAGL
jgi:hypothetical protein